MTTLPDRQRSRPNAEFKLVSEFSPTGDQPGAIDELVAGLARGEKDQVLLGVTGSGKTFTIANVIARVQRPTLILAHNKILAAQLYEEFKAFFPHNAVEYFVSYYDYYQPEAYVPSTDTFIEKDAIINDIIDRMRLSATRSLLERRDVIIVASVSCIYGIGSAEAFYGMLVMVERGMKLDRDQFLRRLIGIRYERSEDFHRGTFRVRGDTVDVFPAYEEQSALRIEFFGDEVDRIVEIDPLRGTATTELDRVPIYPGTLYVVTPDRQHAAVKAIKDELRERVAEFREQNKLVEAQRIDQRCTHDLEMLETTGFCPGIENYSRHFTGRDPGAPPPCLLDYFPDDWLAVIDESHATIGQIGGMYRGDRARKENLVNFGFRLPSALDNRPLKFDEFRALLNQVIYVSATPGDYELEQSTGVITEQLIRPTGLIDPVIEVRPATHQVDDLVAEIRQHVDVLGDRVLVTTLTKRMAEDLTEYLRDQRIRVKYMHSDVETIERMQLIRDLRRGEYDVLVGINLLREGLDLPEVSLVAVLDADKEGFLRSNRSLIQTAGRAARNLHGRVIFYADRITQSMQTAIDETLRRRRVQVEYNTAHNITPRSVVRTIHEVDAPIETDIRKGQRTTDYGPRLERVPLPQNPEEVQREIVALRDQMREAARALEFERAAAIRDRIKVLEQAALVVGV